MQLLFGVTGRRMAVSSVFHRLRDETIRSNPGLDLAETTSGDLVIGHAARRFASWRSKDGDLAFFLDGTIHSISGVDVAAGQAPNELFGRLAGEYRRDVDEFWGRLDGSFCLIVQDGTSVSIGIDVSGTRSMYWWVADGVLAFHRRLSDLATAFPAELTEDAGALASFLAGGIYPPGRTAFKEIGHVGAGQFLRFVEGVARVRDHLAMVYREAEPPRPRRALVDDLIDLVAASVAHSAPYSDAVVVPLSGGLDSRYLLAEMARQSSDLSISTITWGEDRARPASDGVVAARVATALDVTNAWHEKPQVPNFETFARAIYLSSGEADCAIHFPDDHVLHAELAASGFTSLVRGDECFGNGPTLIIRRAAVAINGVSRLRPDGGYAGLINSDRLRYMAEEQESDLARLWRGLRSATATGTRDEVRYNVVLRRVLASYNAVKQNDLEVVTPFLGRRVLEFMRATPDPLRFDKALLKEAFERRFPRLAALPFARRTNLPDWEERWRRDARLAALYRDLCAGPGWLEEIGSQAAVVSQLHHLAVAATEAEPRSAGRAWGAIHTSDWRALAKQTLPGRFMREVTIERRQAAPAYLRLARLAVLHHLIGDIRRRRVSVS